MLTCSDFSWSTAFHTFPARAVPGVAPLWLVQSPVPVPVLLVGMAPVSLEVISVLLSSLVCKHLNTRGVGSGPSSSIDESASQPATCKLTPETSLHVKLPKAAQDLQTWPSYGHDMPVKGANSATNGGRK